MQAWEETYDTMMGLTPFVPGAKVTVEKINGHKPMEHDAQMIRNFAQCKQIGANYGLTIREDGSGGASDGNTVAALGISVLDGLGPQGDGLHALGFRLGDGALRRLELGVDVGVLDFRDDLSLAHAGAFLDPERRNPAAHLHADVAAVPRDDVAGGHEHWQGGRAARRRDHLRRVGDVHLRRAPLGDIRARRWIDGGAGRAEHDENRHRQPASPPRRVTVDAQARQVADG